MVIRSHLFKQKIHFISIAAKKIPSDNQKPGVRKQQVTLILNEG